MYNSYDSHNGTGSSQIILDVDKLKPSKGMQDSVFLNCPVPSGCAQFTNKV